MMSGFANYRKFFIIGNFVRAFALRQLFADAGKKRKSVLPQKKAVYCPRMNFCGGAGGIKPANCQFIGKSVLHYQ
jgi:hypothetical protein